MAPKHQARAADATPKTFYEINHVRPIEEPRVFISMHQGKPRASVAKVPGVEIPDKSGHFTVKAVPVCRHRCSHVNALHRATQPRA